MSIVQKTLWYIESHLDDDLSLGVLAAEAGVSASHLARTFAKATDLPVMRYVWRRRLARAVQALSCGQGAILNVALDAGYASHEAFSRAFRAEFGLSPAMMQALGDPATLSVLQPKDFFMDAPVTLDPPRLVPCGPRTFVGLNAHYTHQTKQGIPQQWERFNMADPEIENSLGRAAYGVIHAFTDDGAWDYACAYEVSRPGAYPDGYQVMTFPARTYAVFSSGDHIASISAVIDGVFSWIAGSEWMFDDGPTLERYGPEFDPVTGKGGFEIWAAVLPRQGQDRHA